MDELSLMEILIQEYGDLLWNFCLRITNDRLIAEDLYRDTMVKAMKLGDEIIKALSSLDIHQFNEYIDLSDYSGEKVILTIKCNKASGNFRFSLEEY